MANVGYVTDQNLRTTDTVEFDIIDVGSYRKAGSVFVGTKSGYDIFSTVPHPTSGYALVTGGIRTPGSDVLIVAASYETGGAIHFVTLDDVTGAYTDLTINPASSYIIALAW
jgi:hypothetical protein